MSTDNNSTNAEGSNQPNIASRTRSHLRIYDFVPHDSLDFPDVDPNLYQNPNSECDSEYKKFLNQCYSEEIVDNDTNTDDNDPEYVYNDDIFSHGWRFDLNEISELHQDERESNCQTGENFTQPSILEICDNQTHYIDGHSASSALNVKSSSKPSKRKIHIFDEPEFARVLNQQLRQHIQLLTQTYLLTKNTTTMRDEAEDAKFHLESYMSIFKNKSKPSNLLPALELVHNLAIPKDLRSSIRSNWRPLPILESIRKIIHRNPNIFMYSRLLPQVAFSKLTRNPSLPKKPKINFTTNEDKLLAFALNEFKGESSQYAYIASLLLTAKTKTQISNHIKNIKRSSGNENNPIKLYFSKGQLPVIDLGEDFNLVDPSSSEADDSNLVDPSTGEVGDPSLVNPTASETDDPSLVNPYSSETDCANLQAFQTMRSHQESEDLMNMELDDLMAASTTISKASTSSSNNGSNSLENKNIRYMKLKKSMLDLMSHNFLLSPRLNDLIVYEFLKVAQMKLTERNYLHLLQLLTDLMRRDAKNESDERIVDIYQEITKFLTKINSPEELNERVVLFLNLEQAKKCGCSLSYLHWMKFFQFMQHLELYHDGSELLEKKLIRLVDSIQKNDPHKVKLALGNLINKHPYLKREFDSLSLDGRPHSSLFVCEEDFDDITEPLSIFDKRHESERELDNLKFEHFNSKLTKGELTYATQSCRCKCHFKSNTDQPGQHCGRCNLKFVKGRMYLVGKIKPILAEWSYSDRVDDLSQGAAHEPVSIWTFEEDKELLEFCRAKAEQNEEAVTFDIPTFEELAKKNRGEHGDSIRLKKTAQEIAERFNQLMELYNENP